MARSPIILKDDGRRTDGDDGWALRGVDILGRGLPAACEGAASGSAANDRGDHLAAPQRRDVAGAAGRSPRGGRLDGPIPHGHWKGTTFVGGPTTRGFRDPRVLDGAASGAV